MAALGGNNGVTKESEEPLRRFYVEDICALKSNRLKVGTVDRTFYDVYSHGPPPDVLIATPVPVPNEELTYFMTKGITPKGFVFVEWCEPGEGYSVVSEDDIELIGRNFQVGHLVKRDQNDTMCGTVIGVNPKYALQPITYRMVDPRSGERGPVRFTRTLTDNRQSSLGTERESPPLLTDIDPEDLKLFPDYSVGNFILRGHKVGVIRDVVSDVVLMLDNETVVQLNDPSLVRMPLSVHSEDIVSPANSFVTRSPCGRDMPNFNPFPGQLASTTQRNVRTGRWIYGRYQANDYHQYIGNILATLINEVHVNWICSNVFSPGSQETETDDDILTPSDLQTSRAYDRLQIPRGASKDNREHARNPLHAGDYVCFRDPIGAAVKYSQFDYIPPSETHGYDTNIFTVLYAAFQVVVQWQDSSITTEVSTSLHRLSGFNEVITPGKIVALKERTQVIPDPCATNVGRLNFGSTPEPNHTIIRLNKVGVIQAVNSQEQVSLVRWFKAPNVELLHNGYVLRPTSVFGELEEESTWVSAYEITTHQGLDRQLSDVVILPPAKIKCHCVSQVPNQSSGAITDESTASVGPCALSFLRPLYFVQTSDYLKTIVQIWARTGWFERSVEFEKCAHPFGHYATSFDWVGHIVGLNLDGTVTVRLGALEHCHDVRVPFEAILLVLDEDMTGLDDDGSSGLLEDIEEELRDVEMMDIDDQQNIFDRLAKSLRSSQSEGWSTVSNEDSDESLGSEESLQDHREERSDSLEEEHRQEYVHNGGLKQQINNIVNEHVFRTQSSLLQKDAGVSFPAGDRHPDGMLPKPSNFVIMDTQPPPDHYFFSTSPSERKGSLSLRRLAKEYSILLDSLPPDIFARTWESRMDLLRVLIIGPAGTPYEYAPYVIDFHFDSDFPENPPRAFFHSWTNGMGQINPNLYEEGKICLSILNTWLSENPDENWSSNNSTVLQILVSLLGLVLVKDPFYNEAGYDTLAPEGARRVESSQYTEKVFVMTRAFIKHALENPVGDVEDILAWHYLPGPPSDNRPNLLKKAIVEAHRMIDHHNSQPSQTEGENGAPASPFVARLSLGAVVMLRKHLDVLERIYTQHQIVHDNDLSEL